MRGSIVALVPLALLGCTTPVFLDDVPDADMDASVVDARVDPLDAAMDAPPDAPPDAGMCLPGASPCTTSSQCCDGRQCAEIMEPPSVVCCGGLGAPCSDPDGRDCCGSVPCRGGVCG